MTSIICPACNGNGVRVFQPYVKESPYDIEVTCDLCKDQGLPGQPRRVALWLGRRWLRRPTTPRNPYVKRVRR